jgi:RimJ/RimL family protein N-acetyltransferase
MPQVDHAPALEGTLVRLRAYEPVDAPVLTELQNHVEVLDGLTAAWPDRPDQTEAWFAAAAAAEDKVSFVIERLDDPRPIGVVTLAAIEAPQRTSILAIFIGAPYFDMGYGTDAVRTMARFAFRHMNVQRIELNVLTNNPRARHAYEKVGFRVEGTRRRGEFSHGEYVDAYLMGLLAEELIDA